MRGFLIRVLQAAFGVVILFYILPLFLRVVGFAPGGDLWALLKACVACLAVVYVCFGPKEPPVPW